MAWNDSPVTGTGTLLSPDLSATGGGVSTLFSKPSWQTGPGVPNDQQRDVPDVSLSGSANHDGYLVCSQGFCTNGFRDSAGALDVFGGTSVGSQAFAGILAILNQATHSNGLGNVNPTLYALAANPNTANAFHDVTSGNNIVPCTQGSPNCPMSSPFQFGYSAGVGYDLATGLGSVNVANLVTNVPNLPPSFTAGGAPVTVAAGSLGNAMITVTPVGGFMGLVVVTCPAPMTSLPPGVTCTPNPLNINVTSSLPATGQLMVSVAAPSAPGTTAEVRPASRTEYASIQGGPTGRNGCWKLSAGTGLAAIFLVLVPGRRRNRTALGLWLVCLLSFAMGCGGGGGVVGPVATNTKITARVTKAAQGTQLSFNIAVTASGAPAGNGMVQLLDGGTVLATVPVVNGAVTIMNNTLSVGTHAISAHYLGDASTQPSTSGAVNVTLTGITQVTISTNPASSNGNTAFNLTIN
jgi:hypothetical protein